MLAMPAVGLSISDHALRYVEFRVHKGIRSLKTWGEYPLEAGIVVDGTIAQKEKLLTVLTKLAREKSVTWVHAALPEEKAFIYGTTVSFPENTSATKKEAAEAAHMLRDHIVPRGAVEATLAQNIPLAPGETIFDFSVLSFDEKSRSAKVQVYAFPVEIANSYADILTAAGMVPLSLETESQAIARAVLPAGKVGTDLIVHIMTYKTIIAVVSDGRVMYASTVATPQNNPQKNKDDADKVSVKESIELLTIREELSKVVSYWHSRGREKKDTIQSVVVSGNVETMLDLPDYISKHVHIPSKLASVWQNAFSVDQYVPDMVFEKSLEYATASGLALASLTPAGEHISSSHT